MFENPFALPIEKILAQSGRDSEHGLNSEEAARRLEKYGLNQIPEQGSKSRWHTRRPVAGSHHLYFGRSGRTRIFVQRLVRGLRDFSRNPDFRRYRIFYGATGHTLLRG